MLKNLIPLLEKPPLYAKTTLPFWDDDHISLQMLSAHLAPNVEAASRSPGFMDRSVHWISQTLPPEQYPAVLDIGCGPGLYTQRYAAKGYSAAGVDISHRSIRYAQANAWERGLPIRYFCQDYLDLSLTTQYDFATMIYCDYGALSTEDRVRLLNNIHQHLKPGGKLLLDVLSLAALERFQEGQTWEVCPDGGFWHPEQYICLNRACKYPRHVTLRQTFVVTDESVRSYCLWDTYFSKSSLSEEAQACGFKPCGFFGDVAGSAYAEESPTLAVLLTRD